MPLFILFVIIPIVEIAIFIQVGGLIGLWPTIGLVLLSAVVGSILIRQQGAKALRDVQTSFATLNDPTTPMAHGAMILLAGVLMITPGFFTDAVGLLLLIPAVRLWVMRQMSSRVTVVRQGFGAGTARGFQGREPHRPPYDRGVIDAEYTVQEDPPTPPQDSGDDRPARPGNSGWTRH